MAEQTEIAEPVTLDNPAPDTPAPEVKDEGPKTSFEAMTAAMDAMKAKAEAAPEAKVEEAAPEAKAAEPEVDTPEEKKAFQGKTAEETIRALRADRKRERAELARLKPLEAEIEPLRQRAAQFDELSNWVRSSGMAPEDVTQSLQITALMKSDPIKAIEVVRPIWEELNRRAGVTLPDDIAAQVQTGEISETAAQELSRLRRERELLAGRVDQSAQAEQERRQAESIANLQRSVSTAVSAAEAELSGKDVDFDRKKPMIQQAVQALMMQEGVPNSAEAAVAQYRKAVKSVNDQLSTILPKRPAVAQIHNSTGGPQVPAPTSAAEAVRQRALAMGMKISG